MKRREAAIAPHHLLLLRHAKSSWDEPGLADPDRPLNDRGRRAATAMGRAMQDLGLRPDLVLVSNARRTRETLERLQLLPGSPVIRELAALYLATVPQMLALLQAVEESVGGVLVIGHNPGLHELATTLVGREAMTLANDMMRHLERAYPSGALTEFTLPGPWAELGEGGGRLLRFLRPRDLPELAS